MTAKNPPKKENELAEKVSEDLYTPEEKPTGASTFSRIGIWLLTGVIVVTGVSIWNQRRDPGPGDQTPFVADGCDGFSQSQGSDFITDFSMISVERNLLLSGGPGKDGIPALCNPEFESLDETSIADTTRGILVERNGEKKFYPYNILVWHEIVNDTVGGEELAITFCPLCGSAVVFNRTVAGEQVDFKVSGLLYESNMVMYDTTSESFFSQSTGMGIAGLHNGVQLQHEPFQLLLLSEVKQDHPDAVIQSLNTGHSRNYAFYPYGNYDNDDSLYFPVQHEDDRYSGKEIFYIVPREDDSVAIRIGEVQRDGSVEASEFGLRIEKDGSEVSVFDTDGNLVPGYYEMWFSWATQHPDSGSVFDPSVSS